MAKVHYLLKDKESKFPTLILIVYRTPDGKTTRSTKFTINKDDWDFKSQLPNVTKNRRDLAELRQKLGRYKLDIETMILRLSNDSMPIDKNNIEIIIDQVLGRPNKNTTKSSSVKSFVYNTMMKAKGYDNVVMMKYGMKHLEEFHPGITIDELNFENQQLFREYLERKSASKNSIFHYLSFYKATAKAIEFSYNINLSSSRMKSVNREKNHKVVLTVDELIDIYRCDTYTEKEREAVNFFLIMAFTGIRKKDAFKSGDVNFKDGEFYVIDTQKTGKRVMVPQHWIVKEIIEKDHGFNIPKWDIYYTMTIIRKALRKTKLSGTYIYTITKGGKKISTVMDRIDKISYHTSRRSFATNLYKAGIPIKVAMMFTGHSTIQQFLDYIMIEQLDNAEEYQNHTFFTGQ